MVVGLELMCAKRGSSKTWSILYMTEIYVGEWVKCEKLLGGYPSALVFKYFLLKCQKSAGQFTSWCHQLVLAASLEYYESERTWKKCYFHRFELTIMDKQRLLQLWVAEVTSLISEYHKIRSLFIFLWIIETNRKLRRSKIHITRLCAVKILVEWLLKCSLENISINRECNGN